MHVHHRLDYSLHSGQQVAGYWPVACLEALVVLFETDEGVVVGDGWELIGGRLGAAEAILEELLVQVPAVRHVW
jgi:hypothetical protein